VVVTDYGRGEFHRGARSGTEGVSVAKKPGRETKQSRAIIQTRKPRRLVTMKEEQIWSTMKEEEIGVDFNLNG